MKLKAPNRNHFWASLIVEELVRGGCTTFFASPGSRSTPLVTAAFRHPSADVHMHFDERGSAFMALGFGKATSKPAAWITTSGTALANGYPAIVEGAMEGVPMILLTADRPPELRDTDANQTIRQDHLFGQYVEWFVDLPVPTDDIDPTFVLSTVDQAVHRSIHGPVHLNCMFREPLAPSEEPYSPKQSVRFEQWEQSTQPFTMYSSDGATPIATLKNIERLLAQAKRPMLVLGRLSGQGSIIQSAAEHLAQAFGGIFVSDISSQSRLGLTAVHGIAHIDALLFGDTDADLQPDLILQFGATSVSKRLGTFLNELPSAHYVVIDDRLRRIDSGHRVAVRVEANPVHVLTRLSERSAAGSTSSDWQRRWIALGELSSDWLSEETCARGVTEQAVSYLLSRALKENTALTVGSSNSIRHMDMCADPSGLNVPVLTNRGASGIDGTLASGVGFSIGHGARPVILLGDLTLLHDLNSLALCSTARAIVIVVNNDGGGIFSYLPIRAHSDVFESAFATPHGFQFEDAASLFRLRYANPEAINDLELALEAAFQSAEGIIIEVNTNRDDNLEEVRRLCRNLSERIQSAAN
ncbi:MAG: 2-succinyl-5-enolpyruvyl-6-hydroxy-3-cyclohexene-1-carboxylic-acid synthase [Bacteroidetes Order II. Incertae sedis bacterium]|nr:2-succinyl-5-enolpyruvyl-6-hydroxy-3-cyclohexene-1-carboxylic-acid synthase [Bacteroidetes Order II. bacterium]